MRVQKLKLRVFGVLRNHSDANGVIELEFESPVDVKTGADLKAELMRHFEKHGAGFDPGILRECALADEESVLSPGERLRTLQNLALLPPVCGG
jgi:molybdopterin converting factor small subunit